MRWKFGARPFSSTSGLDFPDPALWTVRGYLPRDERGGYPAGDIYPYTLETLPQPQSGPAPWAREPEPKIVATSQTRWRDLPDAWRDTATRAIVDAGYGETTMAAVAVIACALWELTQVDG